MHRPIESFGAQYVGCMGVNTSIPTSLTPLSTKPFSRLNCEVGMSGLVDVLDPEPFRIAGVKEDDVPVADGRCRLFQIRYVDGNGAFAADVDDHTSPVN